MRPRLKLTSWWDLGLNSEIVAEIWSRNLKYCGWNLKPREVINSKSTVNKMTIYSYSTKELPGRLYPRLNLKRTNSLVTISARLSSVISTLGTFLANRAQLTICPTPGLLRSLREALQFSRSTGLSSFNILVGKRVHQLRPCARWFRWSATGTKWSGITSRAWRRMNRLAVSSLEMKQLTED